MSYFNSLLFVGDQHFDTVPPRSRIDDYLESLFEKINEIAEHAERLNVSCIIWSGDMFNKQRPSLVPYSLVNRLIDYFNYLRKKGKISYVAMGNHDVLAHPDQWRKQPIGSLVESGAIEPLWNDRSDENPWGKRTIAIDDNLYLHGSQFSYHCDKPDNRGSFYSIDRKNPVSADQNVWNIRVVHSALTPYGRNAFGDFTSLDQLAFTVPPDKTSDLYLCGHLHEFYGEYQFPYPHGLIRAYNPGALSRGSIDEMNLTRQVQIGHVIIDSGYGIIIDDVHLKCMKPASEVFSSHEHHQQKQRLEEIRQLAAMLQVDLLTDEFCPVNLDEAVDKFISNSSLRDPVKQLLNEYIIDAKTHCS